MKTVQFEWTIGMYRKWRIWRNFVHCHVSLPEGYYDVCLPYLMPWPTAPCHVFVKQCKPQKRQRFVQEGQGSFFFFGGGGANTWRDFEGFALMGWFYFMTPKNLGFTHQSLPFGARKCRLFSEPVQGNRFAYIVGRPNWYEGLDRSKFGRRYRVIRVSWYWRMWLVWKNVIHNISCDSWILQGDPITPVTERVSWLEHAPRVKVYLRYSSIEKGVQSACFSSPEGLLFWMW